ncbi:interleukin-17F-like [Alosa alosa]|uniref:interleukin-17F-like n=1 Tax=Alosa alosa TaxID=278164 RepID=UPI00201511D9|nr:interleukin-17F-like [Alosa alosa]
MYPWDDQVQNNTVPPCRVGDFILTFPFNEVTLKASQKKLNIKVAVQEVHKLTSQLLSSRVHKGNTTSDINRIPKFISEVRCLKQGCIWPNGLEDQGLASVPIQLEVLVLKRSGRGQRKGKRRSSTILYKPSYQVITVGCTCVRPIVTEMTD